MRHVAPSPPKPRFKGEGDQRQNAYSTSTPYIRGALIVA